VDHLTLLAKLERFATEAIATGRYRDMDGLLRTGGGLLQRLEEELRRFVASLQAAEAEADRVGRATSVKCLDSTQSGGSRVACPEPPDATLLGHSGQAAE
jgi:Arc/MetJ-type ribon-helix-helix transcriptional regulator